MGRDRLLRSGNEQNPPTNDRFEVGNPPYFCSVKLQIMNGNSKTFLLVLLGMLTAFGPFVTDIRQFIVPPPKHPCRLNATGVFVNVPRE